MKELHNGTWKTVKLGDVTSWSSGGTPSKNVSSYWNGNIPWISAKTMPEGYIDSSSITITEEGLKAGSQLAPANSILMLVRGSGLYNRRYINMVRRPVAFNQDVKCIEAKDGALTVFLYYLLKACDANLLEMLESTGIGAGKFDTKRLQAMPMQLPDLQTQQKIADFFSTLDAKVEVNQQINHNLRFAA